MPSPPETIASWHPGSPRDEIRPDFAIDPAGGRDGVGALVISMDGREGLHGYWRRAFPVVGGQHYGFSAWRRAVGVANPRRQVVARILWQDDAGKPVPLGWPVVEGYLVHWGPSAAEPEHPVDGQHDDAGWNEVTGHYRAPEAATCPAAKERYALSGGASPLPGITMRQARALQDRLTRDLPGPVRVRPGFLYGEPSVTDCVRALDAAQVVALPMSPFSSRLTSGRYRAGLAAAEVSRQPFPRPTCGGLTRASTSPNPMTRTMSERQSSSRVSPAASALVPSEDSVTCLSA